MSLSHPLVFPLLLTIFPSRCVLIGRCFFLIQDEIKSAARMAADKSETSERNHWGSEFLSLPLTLVGFSKGCILLNQLVYELETGQSSLPAQGKQRTGRHAAGSNSSDVTAGETHVRTASACGAASRTEESAACSRSSCPPSSKLTSVAPSLSASSHSSLAERGDRRPRLAHLSSSSSESLSQSSRPWLWAFFSCFIWLDGGHCGEKNAWLSKANLVNALLSAVTRVEIHTTPYQVRFLSVCLSVCLSIFCFVCVWHDRVFSVA